MAATWLAVGKFIVGNLDTIIAVAKPLFTPKKVESLPGQADLLNQQISELQTASSTNSEQIKELAAQLKSFVTVVEEAALKAAAERDRVRKLSLLAVSVSVVSLVVAVWAVLAR